MSTEKPCPHCQQTPAEKSWPFCSWCGLFLVEIDELDLDPKAEIPTWHRKPKIAAGLH